MCSLLSTIIEKKLEFLAFEYVKFFEILFVLEEMFRLYTINKFLSSKIGKIRRILEKIYFV